MADFSVFPQTCGSYILSESIGKGTYGYVYKAKSNQPAGGSRTSQKEFAIKRIEYSSANETEQKYALQEVEVMKKCDHLNIVSYYDSFFEKETRYFCIVMELCSTNLRDYIKQQERPMSEETFIKLFHQLCTGVEYLHSNDIVHRDLKPTNILLTNDDTVKIADFGVAKVLDLTMFNPQSIVGTHKYMSPEMHQTKDYDDKTDIWSLGCTAYEMATGKQAYTKQSLVELKNQLGLGQVPDFEEIRYCSDMKELIKSMLNISSPKRPKASTIVNKLSRHTPCEETESTHSSEDQNVDSGYAAGGSGSLREPRRRISSESDKFCVNVSTEIQASLVKILQGAEPVTEILKILRTEKNRKAQRKAIMEIAGSKYQEIRPLIKSLRPVEDKLSQSFSDFSTASSATSQSSTEDIYVTM